MRCGHTRHQQLEGLYIYMHTPEYIYIYTYGSILEKEGKASKECSENKCNEKELEARTRPRVAMRAL